MWYQYPSASLNAGTPLEVMGQWQLPCFIPPGKSGFDLLARLDQVVARLEQRLPVTHFFRANRQYIVNLQSMKSVEESMSKGFSLVMSDGKEIEISRRRASVLTKALNFSEPSRSDAVSVPRPQEKR